MQGIAEETFSAPQDRTGAGINLSVEMMIVLALLAVALLTRMIALGAPAITDMEVAPALDAWRSVSVDAEQDIDMPDSTLRFWSQRVAFALLGSSEASARLITAIAGALLCLTPLLFRDFVGRWQAFAWVIVLIFSPVSLAASRLSSPVIWSMLLVMIALWAISQYWDADSRQRQINMGLLAMVSGTAGLLLSEPGAPVLALILLGALLLAIAYLGSRIPDDDSEIDMVDNPAQIMRERFSGWPWAMGSVLSLLVVFAVGTGFLMYTPGLQTISATLQAFLDGFSQPLPDAPLAYPLVTAFFYETWLFLLAAIGVVLMVATQDIRFPNAFLAACFLTAFVASLIYQGAGAAHSLWLIMPLAGLTAYAVTRALDVVKVPLMWMADFMADDERRRQVGIAGKWLVAGLMFVLLAMIASHFQLAMRGFWIASEGQLGDFISRLDESAFNRYFISLIWILIGLLLTLVGFFLASSVWGNIIPAQGMLLGLFGFMVFTNIGSGANLVGVRSNDASEPWYVVGTSDQTALLRETLQDFAFRETQNFALLPVTVVGDDDGIVAWLLRDFSDVTFVDSVAEAMRQPVILIPVSELAVEGEDRIRRPDLGGSYVGQQFEISTIWSVSWINGWQILPWWVERLDNLPDAAEPFVVQPLPLEEVILWVRQDIYDGVPFTPLQ